ncbi:hypothetical protein ACH4U5_30480 [Streptomyces sp. NPDC020858]|uniref:hypothetical protein n=1 Tax=Streptomyces sp. NPDC020858 TaxID=3365097 RepID=UPI0037898A7E
MRPIQRHTPTRALRAAASLLALSGLTTGCGFGGIGQADKKPTMQIQQGAERADAILQETLGAVQPELEWNHGPYGDTGCTKGIAGAPAIPAAPRESRARPRAPRPPTGPSPS